MRKLKILLIIITWVVCIDISAQQQPISDVNFGDTPRPVPSVSSLATYTDAPVSLATGIPDINFPLLGLSSKDKNIAANLSLQYHPLNMDAPEAGSEVGIGWSMFAGGVISREIVDEVDERYDDPNFQGYKKNKFNDIYYYNLPGISGKFKIERNIDTNTFQIVNLTPNNIKIEYVRSNNTATLIVDSFTITDDNGYVYIFNDSSRNRSYTHPLTSGRLFKSAFYLTQIRNAGNIELLNFVYQKDAKNKPGTGELLYESCKLKTIVSPGMGSIAIDYYYNVSLEGTMNDPYGITKISLKNNTGSTVSQYGFEYSMMSYFYTGFEQGQNKRTLSRINKINLADPAGSALETTKLLYTTYTIGDSNGDRSCGSTQPATGVIINSLYRVILPTGGMVEYNLEANDVYFNKNYPGYVTSQYFTDPDAQFIEYFGGVEFDVPNGKTKSYTFQVPGEPGEYKKIYADFEATKYYPLYGLVEPYSNVDYVLDDNPGLGTTCYIFNDDALEGNAWSFRTFYLTPGTHKIKIFGTGGHGTFALSHIQNKPQPYRNAKINYPKPGLRIKNIKYYNSSMDFIPRKTVGYDYNVFGDPNSSSGYGFYPEMEGSFSDYTLTVLYRNVKVTNDNDNGYINYYFKNPNDYPKTPYTQNGITTNFWPYYNITKSGVMEKKEVFNNQNQLVSFVNYDFTFETLNQMPEVPVNGGVSKKAYIKSSKVITRDYTGTNRFVESKVETEFNPINFKVASVKETSSDGNVSEKFITYSAGSAEYQNLENAFMNGVPVKTEIKNNGKMVSNTVVKYQNQSNLYPSSVITINPNDNSSKTAVTYDEYDSKGNVKQFTSDITSAGSGNSTVVIWGYNQAYPIAKIEGAKLSDIGNLADDIMQKSNADTDQASENILINALDSFRTHTALRTFLITTYTYDPLVGATTVTPPNGLREIYRYDKNGRLTSVVDVNGNIIKDYKYNTKPQL